MRKSQLTYLRRIIGNAIAERNREELTETVLGIKAPSSGIYRMMRDIVCDARFYSVTDNDPFWKTYGADRIGGFIDTLSPEEQEDNGRLTMLKEDFLNEWMAENMIPLSTDRRKELEAEIKAKQTDDDGIGIPDPDEHDGLSLGIINLGNCIKDTTNQTGEPAGDLPPQMNDYMQDASGGNSAGLHTDSHVAEARFLDSIDPSIVRLAMKIGRRGGDSEPTRGKFRQAPKSDISGVTVGNDLNSVLPSELALLADPASERIFIDRFVRKRLQTFSSVSASRNEKTKGGPIFMCVDTSGSMVGKPEQLAKTLALAICIVAQKERRPVCILNYSDSLSFFVLRDLNAQRKKLLRFLSESYGGGNDENKLFRFLLGRMPKMPAYRDFAKELKGADMLVISDFLWMPIEDEVAAMIDGARSRGMRIFTVGIEPDENISLFEHFYLRSDFRHIFRDGTIKEDLR